jgi:hypothetical protein
MDAEAPVPAMTVDAGVMVDVRGALRTVGLGVVLFLFSPSVIAWDGLRLPKDLLLGMIIWGVVLVPNGLVPSLLRRGAVVLLVATAVPMLSFALPDGAASAVIGASLLAVSAGPWFFSWLFGEIAAALGLAPVAARWRRVRGRWLVPLAAASATAVVVIVAGIAGGELSPWPPSPGLSVVVGRWYYAADGATGAAVVLLALFHVIQLVAMIGPFRATGRAIDAALANSPAPVEP